MSSAKDEQLRAIFRDEAAEILDELRLLVSRLRSAGAGEAQDELATAMRLAHNLKGAAGSVGFDALAELAHVVEDVFVALGGAGFEAIAATVPVLAEAVTTLERLAEGRTDEASSVEARLAARLRELGPEGRSSAKTAPPQATDSPPSDTEETSPELAATRPEAAAPSGGATVKVDAERLDRIFELASELLVTETDMRRRHESLESVRATFLSFLGALPREARTGGGAALRMLEGLLEDHRRSVDSFARLASDLHDAMKQARMVPLAHLSASLRRTVDDAALSVGKNVDLELELAGIELDKVVLDRLRDPLVHLLRNAVDHGIEAAGARDVLGKPERGLVVVRAEIIGTTVRIEVADDGRGIDASSVGRSAVAKRLASAADVASMDEAALVDLLFAEGFSTRDRATLLSGRGVGLDVVRRAVSALGGSVRAEPRGQLGGASFELTVPLSVLSTRLLLVRVGDVLYALPVQAIGRAVRVPKHAVKTVDGQTVMTSDGNHAALPLSWLGHALGGRGGRDSELLRALVLEHRGTSRAFVVDEVLREEDLVVRKLPWNLVSVPGVSGAVALADGSVAIVVDVPYLFSRGAAAPAAREDATSRGQKRILVADDSMTTRTLHRNLLVGAGYDVVTAHDGSEAWERLQRERVDLVVSDVQMPGLDGFALTRRIRTDARLGGLPVVLVTSLARAEDVQRGLDAGADEYVVKGPLEQDALLAAVGRHVG